MMILIDPGHGGSDAGAVAGGIREADLVLSYGLRLRDVLRGRGHTVHMTRDTDAFPTLQARSRQANMLAVDCFVSVHANASGNEEAHGFQVFHAEGSVPGRALAASILGAVTPVSGETRWTGFFADGTPHTGNRTLHVLRATQMPAVLVELGFLTHEGERRLMLDFDYRRRICDAIADGIESWAGVERTPDLPDPVVRVEDSTAGLRVPPPKLPERMDILLTRPVADVALPDETAAGFLQRVGGAAGDVLGPIARVLWERLLAMIIARLEREADRAADRVLPPTGD